MATSLDIFAKRLNEEWLPSFCNASHRNYSSEGFKKETIARLDEFDASWFLQAINDGLVSELDGFFIAPKSKAKEQIFWQGSKAKSPRPITLWVEPIITMGALARLHEEFGWPIKNLGMQSKTWAFDLVGYKTNSNQEILACEVKKHNKEILSLLNFMQFYSSKEPIDTEPDNSVERNAYRKVKGIRESWPSVFWALGPDGQGQVFLIQRISGGQTFDLRPTDFQALNYKNA